MNNQNQGGSQDGGMGGQDRQQQQQDGGDRQQGGAQSGGHQQQEDRGQSGGGQSGQGGGGVMEKAKDYGKTAVQKVDQNRDKAAGLLTTGAQKVRQWGGNTQYGQQIETAAQGLEKAANYVRERDLNAMGGDVGNWVRQSPTQAVVVALGAGFLLGYAMKRR